MLALGVIVSMFSAITVTRTFLKALVGTTALQHLWLFGSDVAAAREAAAADRFPRVTGGSVGGSET